MILLLAPVMFVLPIIAQDTSMQAISPMSVDVASSTTTENAQGTPPATIASTLGTLPFKFNFSNGTFQLPIETPDGNELLLTFFAREWLSEPSALQGIPVRRQYGKQYQPIAIIEKAQLSTCRNVQHPHYEVRASKITLYAQMLGDTLNTADLLLDARGVGLELFGVRLPSSPFPLIASTVARELPLPMPSVSLGSSEIDGLYLDASVKYNLGDRRSMQFETRYGTEGLWRNKLSITQPFNIANSPISGTVTLIASRHEDVSNRWVDTDCMVDGRLRNLTISRLPALQVITEPMHLIPQYPGSSFHFGGGIGYYHEEPTDVSRARIQAWGIFRAPIGHLGPLALTGEFGLRAAHYGASMHRAYIAELSAATPPNRDWSLDISYLRRREAGTSPFLFDRVLINDELYSEVGFPLGNNSPFMLNVANRYDLSSGKARTLPITAIYRDDCFMYGLSYDPLLNEYRAGLEFRGFGTFRTGARRIEFLQ